MRKTVSRLVLAGAVAGALGLIAAAPSLAATTEVVTPADVNTGGDWYTADTRPPGTGTFEAGPGTPPLGAASFELRTPTPTSKVQLLTDEYDGVALADLTTLEYSTYRDPGSTGFVAGVAALNLRVDINNDGNPDSYFVYEPYQSEGNDAVQTGVWQEWDAIDGGAAKWWVDNGGPTTCGQSNPCTWTQLLATYPGATIQEGTNFPGSLGFNQGSGNTGFVSNVDALVVGVDGNDTTYDFELIRDLDGDGTADTPPPTDKDQCKNGGYATFNNPSFRNQGQCVSYVNGRR